MLTPIFLIIAGIAVAGAGLYYLSKSKDAESRKIYGITTAVGAVICAVGVALLVL